jgi:hypothetical protein
MDSVGNRWIVETYGNEFVSATTKCKCKCGSIILNTPKTRCKHFSTKKHIKYAIENCEIMYREEHPELYEEIPLPLPTPIQEIEELPIPDVIIEPIEEITASVPDTPLTKAEIAKKKKQEYMRVYMRKYHSKRYNEDEEYRKYRIEMTNKSSCVMRTRYIKAYQYIKDNNIAIFDEKGN